MNYVNYTRREARFGMDYINYWSHLSRFNNLLVIMNISMFFLTGLVAKGYYFTFYSLIFSCIVGIGVLVPTIMIRRLWYYGIFLVLEMVSLYFLIASLVYWVNNST